jgi:hypothetical protein
MSDEPPAQVLPADPADVESLDGIVNALYDSVSFAVGDEPNWRRFRSLFEPRAVMVRIDPRLTALPASERDDAPLRISGIEDYVARTSAAIDSGALSAFDERELTRRTEVFADLAQVFSTYERSADGGEVHRGINSLQLVKDGTRWWIVALSWSDEADGSPLPGRYLPRP